MLPALIVLAAALVLAAAIAAWTVLSAARRRKLLGAPFPEPWRQTLVSEVALYRLAPLEIKPRLHDLIRLFLLDKRFEGCQGLRVTDKMRLVVAAQACLLALNRRTAPFPGVSTVLLYPGAFVTLEDGEDDMGWVEGEEARDGESWGDGAVILSWNETIREARSLKSGSNVVLHEFAHQVDEENGATDGMPRFDDNAREAEWREVMDREYDRLRRSKKPSVIHDDAAESMAEFMATATESFFTRPRRLRQESPALYGVLSRLYGVDPEAWREQPRV